MIEQLKNIGEFKSGYGFPLKYQGIKNGDYPFFKVSDFNNRKNITTMVEANNYISKNIAKTLNITPLKKGSIIFAKIGAAIFLERKKKLIQDSFIDNNMSSFLVDKKIANEDYIYYFLTSKRLGNLVEATALPSLSNKALGNLKINLPEISEQKKIAQYLSDIDLLIENLKNLIEKKKLIKQGVMQDLLTGKKRLPGFNKEWIQKELGELGEFTGGGVDKKSIPGQKKVTLLNFLDVYHRDFIYKKELYHNVTASDAQIRKCTLKKGDLFFTPSSELRTDLALSAVVMEDCPGCVYSYHITRFRFKDEFDLKFKSYVFNNKTFLDQAALAAEGSGKRYVVNLSKFKTLTIAYPTDIKEQAAIATILWDVDQEINSSEQDLEKYKQIKQGMMEQLLTGKIRLVKESDNEQTLPEKKHNQHFDDAVVFANIVASCYDPSYPLGRKKCQKMMYLFKRFNESSVEQFKHYAAGPYDNKARYGGFETIAIKNKYVVENKSSKGSSFAPGAEIEKAKAYCSKYGYDKFIPIFNQYLKYKKVDELELYTTVDKTILELRDQGSPINLKTVKTYISNDKTWVPKLSREVFNDENIEEAIRFSQLVLGA